MVSIEQLHNLFILDTELGKLYNRNNRWHKNAGKEAGWFDSYGYRLVKIKNKPYKVHRIIWAMVYNAWPSGEIDHINRNPSDNTITNLREVTHQQNSLNRRKCKVQTNML